MLKALVLLLSCSLAGIAAAATPEQEMEAEAKKLLPTLFSKCGDDYFSKRTFNYKTGTAYIIGQYKELTPQVKSNPLNKTDPLNGVERRFPRNKSQYSGWLPPLVMAVAVARGAYQSTLDEEARLFYTAATRAERYLYVSGTENLPQARSQGRRSTYALQLARHPAVSPDPTSLPAGRRHRLPHELHRNQILSAVSEKLSVPRALWAQSDRPRNVRLWKGRSYVPPETS